MAEMTDKQAALLATGLIAAAHMTERGYPNIEEIYKALVKVAGIDDDGGSD